MAFKRTAIIAGNWKMNYGPRQAASFAREIIPALSQVLATAGTYPHIISILCPPAISLSAVREVLDTVPTSHIELGAQNIYYEEKGAFTGEIAAGMVRELCSTVILGHSERRTLFGENDKFVNEKMQSAFKHSLRPIVCIGENLVQYEAQQTEAVIRSQVSASLANLDQHNASELVIAYEPIWAIGTGKAATAEGAGKVASLIRQLYQEMYGSEAAAAVRILYGGSVTGTNISDFIAHPDIDGALVGGASIKPDFVEIVRKSVETLQH